MASSKPPPKVIRLSDLPSSPPVASPSPASPSSKPQPFPNLVGDIVERTPRKQTAPSAPTFNSLTATERPAGFPRARKILKKSNIQTGYEERPEVGVEGGDTGARGEEDQWDELKRQIDDENRKKLAEMTEEEILQAQSVLESSFPASLIQKIRERIEPSTPTLSTTARKDNKLSNDHTSQSSTAPQLSNVTPRRSSALNPDPYKTYDSSSTFESHLKSFFPPKSAVETPEWTNPILPSESTFYSSSAEIDASTMRFDLNGVHISLEQGLRMPTHEGLHHHGINPGMAGYTVPELAILLRSSNASQKCIALKAVSGILVSLAKNKFTWDVEQSLWDAVANENVLNILENLKDDIDTDKVVNLSVITYFEDLWTKWVDSGGPDLWRQKELRRKQDELKRMLERGEIEVVRDEDVNAQ